MLCVVLNISNPSFAQGGNEKASEERTNKATDETNNEEPEQHTAAYNILGRELTSKEKDLYANLGEEDIKDELLSRELRLVVVRAIIAVGEPGSIDKILAVWPMSKLQTFTELVQRFQALKEKYGSVREGVESELVFNIKDDEQAFKKAAKKAYETVFCVVPDDQDTVEIVSFLKENKALTYSQMVRKIMDTLTQDDKKDMLFKALDKVGRADLKNNKVFINKMLAQQFNCENLTRLLQDLSPPPVKKPVKK